MTETIQCPICEREWPAISEQGVHTELYDECHYCMTQKIVRLRDKRLKEVDYHIETCYVCAGVNPIMQTCATCDGRGWVAEKNQ